MDEVLRYYTVQVFVVNMDSYLGRIVHTYFLYEENGLLQILPRDYNLAFATYSLGMPDPINNATLYVNYPIHTPTEGEVLLNRPLYHNLMKNSTYFAKYRAYFDQLISGYFENGYFKDFVTKACTMIAPYVERDATAFCSYEDFLFRVDTIRDFCLMRAQGVREHLEKKLWDASQRTSASSFSVSARKITRQSRGLMEQLAARYANVQELEAAMVNELIKKMVIHSPEKIGGKKHVTIEVCFIYVGKIRIPLAKPKLLTDTKTPA